MRQPFLPLLSLFSPKLGRRSVKEKGDGLKRDDKWQPPSLPPSLLPRRRHSPPQSGRPSGWASLGRAFVFRRRFKSPVSPKAGPPFLSLSPALGIYKPSASASSSSQGQAKVTWVSIRNLLCGEATSKHHSLNQSLKKSPCSALYNPLARPQLLDLGARVFRSWEYVCRRKEKAGERAEGRK